MISRASAVFVLFSQGILLLLVHTTSGATATWFSFLGHPAMGVGILLGIWALARERGTARRHDAAGDAPGS